MREITVHGRGGQGAVTAAQLLAIAAFHDKKQSQAFPSFGVERRGAPVEAYCRISDNPINIRSHVYVSDHVIILDASLLDVVDVKKGLKKGGTLIINTKKKPEEFNIKGYNIHTCDASSIALRLFKKDIVNTAVLGAFAKATKLISLNSLCKAVDERFEGKIADLNKKAVKECYEKAH